MLSRISVVEDITEEYRPFMSDESVSLMVDTTRRIPIKILQEFVVTQSVSSGFVSLPLHRIHLRTDLLS